MISADPAKAAEEMDRWAAGLEQKARGYTELQQRMDGTTVTESTVDGAIRVTVDANGAVTDIRFSERATVMAPDRLSTETMACVRRAQARLRAQVEELVAATVPADDEPARAIVAQYRQRFPDVVEDIGEDAGEGFVEDFVEEPENPGGRIGELTEESAPPPTSPRRSTVDSPDDDDWDEGSPLR